MRYRFLIGCAFLVATTCTCQGTAVLAGAGQDVPSSSRSQHAIKRVETKLRLDLKQSGLAYGSPIYIRIFKEERELELWVEKEGRYRLFRSYPICTYGPAGLGPKLKEGDRKAPEGFYYVRPSALNPQSNFHLAFNLGYPNRYDKAHGRTGSALMVHGDCASIGCYAMTDAGIEEIYALADAALRDGQPFFRVHIFPFRMSDANMQRYADSEWREFWLNLQQGYKQFERNGWRPPNVEVVGGRYVFDRLG